MSNVEWGILQEAAEGLSPLRRKLCRSTLSSVLSDKGSVPYPTSSRTLSHTLSSVSDATKEGDEGDDKAKIDKVLRQSLRQSASRRWGSYISGPEVAGRSGGA